MVQEIQSEDKQEHKAGEMERFFSYQEIWYGQYVRPAIKEDVKDQFEKCSVPIVRKIESLNSRLFVKTLMFILIIVITILLSFK